jgi:LPXTG-motif cell wall-anchored protein
VIDRRTARPAVAGALTLGIGLGGFFDGIVFHQILQVHNMLSGWLPVTDLVSAKANMVWDGLFHAAVWLITLLGVGMVWRAAQREDVDFAVRHLVGGLLIGWGLFNLVEGVIDHHLLGVHHVMERLGPSAWDYAFLAWGAAMLAAGWLFTRRRRR